MGHERTGALPHTKHWRDVVTQLAEWSGSQEQLADLAAATLRNVSTQFRKLHTDNGVVAAFQFLLALARNASSIDLPSRSNMPRIDLSDDPSSLRLVAELRSWVYDRQGSPEYADIAIKASSDAIVLWSEQKTNQLTFFESDNRSKDIWRQADSGSGFCEVSRLFFAKFTERYLSYFLDREASAVMKHAEDRDRFATQLRTHIDDVSQFAFETSRITQSFSAGWFNNYARDQIPTEGQFKGFLSRAFGKMREELIRETAGYEQ